MMADAQTDRDTDIQTDRQTDRQAFCRQKQCKTRHACKAVIKWKRCLTIIIIAPPESEACLFCCHEIPRGSLKPASCGKWTEVDTTSSLARHAHQARDAFLHGVQEII